jgi:hypothetical protein
MWRINSSPILILNVAQPFANVAYEAVRKIAGNECRIVNWACACSPAVLFLTQLGDIRPALQEKLASGMDLLQASREVRLLLLVV